MPFPKTPLSIDNKTKDNDMKKKQHLMTLAVLLLLTSCSEQSDMQRTAIDTNAPLTLTASSGTAPTMRAADNLYNAATGFDGTEQAQVYMANSGGTQTGTATYSIGVPTVVAGKKQSPLTLVSENPIYYPSGPSGSVTLYGVYPATSTAKHTVKYDQTSDASYKASDLMYATIPVSWETLAEKYELKPNLPFQHQLVKLKVTVVKMDDVFHLEQVMMNSVKRSVMVAPTYTSAGLGTVASATDETGDGANEDAILISSGETASTVPETKEFTYACVYPAQTWKDGEENAVDFLTVNADGGVAKYKLKKTFLPGYEYTLTVYLNALAVGATVTIDNWSDATDCVVNPTTASGGTLKIAPVGDQTYSGNPITITPPPAVTYTDKNTGTVTTLTIGTDYDLQYYNNTNAGQAIILATGKNGGDGHNYEGQIGLGSFYIIQRDLEQASIADISAKTYKRAAWTPEPTVTCSGKTLVKDADYTLSYSNNTNAGTATVTITAKSDGNFTGSNSKTFTINKKSLSTNSGDFTITLSATSKVYNGSTQSVSVNSVKDTNSGNTESMTLTTDYTVSGTTSTSANVGTYTVTITGQGNYTGTKTATWQITKANASVTTAPTAKTGLKSGTSNALVNAGTASGGTMMYYCSNANTQPATTASGWVSSIPTKSDAGTYYVFYYVKGDSNHKDSSVGGSVTVTVASNDPGVALANASVGYKVCSNGKAYATNATLPSGVSVIGMVACKNGSNGIVLYKSNTTSEWGKSWANRNNDMPSNVSVYVSNLTSKTDKSWTCGTAAQYQSALSGSWTTSAPTTSTNWNLTDVDNLLQAAGCDKLGSNDTDRYWSGTQNGSGSGYAWHFCKGYWKEYGTEDNCFVRPLFEF